MSRTLTLVEYRTEPSVPLTPAERDGLARLAPSVSIAPTVGTTDQYDLTPGSAIGTVTLPGLDILIRPKMPIDRVLFLLSYSIGLTRWQQAPAELEQADAVVEAIITGFAYQAERALKRGVLQGYRSEDDALPTVRGRIRVEDQIRRRHGVVVPAEVTFDEYTEDIDPNRLLKAAIDRLSRLRVRSDRSRWPLRTIDNTLSGVRLMPYHRGSIPSVTWNRLNERYRPAVELARLILASTAYELDHGRIAGTAFLVDMNKLFEDFVVIALRETLAVTERQLVQGARGRSLWLDAARQVRLEPDLSWWDGGTCTFVGDVKYKRISVAGYKHADLYQMLAYTVATGLPGGLLIYAAGETDPWVHEVVQLGKRLQIVGLDLSGTPEQLLAQVKAVADLIRLHRQTVTVQQRIPA